MDIKDIFARNLKQAMEKTTDLQTPGELSKRARWPRGKKAGDLISPRQIGYALDRRKEAPSPTLDFVQAVSKALGLQPWELLLDSAESRREILDKLMSGVFVPDARLTGSAFDAAGKTLAPPIKRATVAKMVKRKRS